MPPLHDIVVDMVTMRPEHPWSIAKTHPHALREVLRVWNNNNDDEDNGAGAAQEWIRAQLQPVKPGGALGNYLFKLHYFVVWRRRPSYCWP